jgi:tetratricopeptide (TPR) repeat protein
MGDETDTAILQELVADEKWAEILRRTESPSNGQHLTAGHHFFRGLAQLHVGTAQIALDSINRGLALNPNSDWGNQLAFEARLTLGEADTAFAKFKDYIERAPGREPQKAWYVQKASEMGLFHIAAEMNETREVITAGRQRPQYALALQCFSKADTLAKTFASLGTLDSTKEFGLVIIIDSCNGSNLNQKHVKGNADVKRLVAAEIPQLMDLFFSVEVLQNERNLGTAPTCRRMLDHVTNIYSGFVFIEDDCLLAPSALEWCQHHLKMTVHTTGPWFVSCESIFFDRQTREITAEQEKHLAEFAAQPGIRNAYHLLNFVPSTCFGTTSEIWKLCANVRSFTRGPESLTRYMTTMGRKTVSPVVPRASDIGMQHELGYSVTLMGRANVKETKTTYLMAEGKFDPDDSTPIVGSIDRLYAATSLLKTEHLETFKSKNARAKA